MDEIIKEIRAILHITQEQLAEMMGVSSITVNRWENEKASPSVMAQKQLYEICHKNQINLIEFLMKRELIEGKNNILFHASRNGIEGNIKPISRLKCDFGKGFYMGTDPLQPLTLVSNEDNPVFYTLEFDLSNLSVLDIEIGLEWAMLIAYYRGYMDNFKNTNLYQKYSHLADEYDVIVGYIADNRMYQVLTDFFEGRIMDTALIASLSALKLGKQYVAITEKACNQIKIIKSRKLNKFELMLLADKSEIRRKEGKDIANEMVILHRRDGHFFDELMKGNS